MRLKEHQFKENGVTKKPKKKRQRNQDSEGFAILSQEIKRKGKQTKHENYKN